MVKYVQVQDLFYGGILVLCILLASISWDGFEPQPPVQLDPGSEVQAEVIVSQQKFRDAYQGLVHNAVFHAKGYGDHTPGCSVSSCSIKVQLIDLTVVWF